MLDNLGHPQPSQVLVDIAPALNALYSLTTVAEARQSPGIGDWAVQTRDALSEGEWEKHKIIAHWIGAEALGNVVGGGAALDSFSAYLQALAAKDAGDLRDELLYWMMARPGARLNFKHMPDVENPLSLLESEEAYLAFYGHPDLVEEKRLAARQVYAYLVDPPALHSLIVDYLGFFWSEHLEAEWERILPQLEEALRGFEKIDFTGMSHFEVIEAVTRRNLRGTFRPEVLQSYATLRFIPSAHSGPYILKTSDGQELRINFGAHYLRELVRDVQEKDGVYIVEQMRALADETRLEILQMLRTEGELGTQEIIERLDLSKSAASRHLRQLYATGIVDMRVDEDGLSKYYRINQAKAGEMQALFGKLLG